MVLGFGKKKEKESEEKKENKEVKNILEEELKNKGYDISKYKLFILKVFKGNDYIYLPSIDAKYLNMVISSNDFKILDIKELESEIIKIEVESPELYDRVKSVLGFLEKFGQFGF